MRLIHFIFNVTAGREQRSYAKGLDFEVLLKLKAKEGKGVEKTREEKVLYPYDP
jgi:hypothetical protein